MSERERWIVYPLIFFALGAAIRDKMFRHVASKEVACERLLADEIYCQKVVVYDRDDPRLSLVQLGQGTKQPNDGSDTSNLGVLVLRDSKGEALCGVTNDSLYVKSVVCEAASVVASRQNSDPLIQLGSIAARNNLTGKMAEVGILSVNSQSYYGAPGQQFTPLVPATRPQQLQKPSSSPATEESPAATDPVSETASQDGSNSAGVTDGAIPSEEDQPAETKIE